MKAKEYSRLFDEVCRETDWDTAAKVVIEKFLTETNQIRVERKIKTDSAFIALLNEQNDKWKAFSRMQPTANPYGFALIIWNHHPFIFGIWLETMPLACQRELREVVKAAKEILDIYRETQEHGKVSEHEK